MTCSLRILPKVKLICWNYSLLFTTHLGEERVRAVSKPSANAHTADIYYLGGNQA